MRPTELVYSSHDRCEHIHRDWIVQRALESWDNKTVFYLPMSSNSHGDQQFSWGSFSWYFDRFRQYGLEPRTFLFTDRMSRDDAQRFFDWLSGSEVVILGGGSTATGLGRYRAMGERFFGNPNAFLETLRWRHRQGKMTVGFSAGADQLCQHSLDDSGFTYGLVRDVVVTLHYEQAGAGHVQHLASRYPDCLVFGLPNDSGLAVCEGQTWRGNSWQLIQLIHDRSWDKPEDGWHIKSRQGVGIEHRYADGRNWTFHGGEVLLRVFYAGGGAESWIKRPEVPVFHHRDSQHETGYRTVEQILDER